MHSTTGSAARTHTQHAVPRRTFVRTATAAGAATPAVFAAGSAAPSRKVRLGLIGCGGRGRQLLEVLGRFPDVDVVAVSDVFEERMGKTAEQLAALDRPHTPDLVMEHERILDRRDVDAVVIATPQHWHGLPFIQAVQAGKHAYVEKPFSHTVAEGRAMVEAARKAGVTAVMGVQQRGYPHFVAAMEIVRSGRLGRIAMVDCWNSERAGQRVGRPADADPPAGLHWDRWLGPAPSVPFNPARLNNSWWFDYGGGMLTNWAIHHLDIILAAMQATSPTTVTCTGGRFSVDDLADTPDTLTAAWQFPEFLLQYSFRSGNTFRPVQHRERRHGICFHGSRATLVLDRYGHELWEEGELPKLVPGEENPRRLKDGKPGNEVDGPWQRMFVDCVLEGRRPPMDLEEAHRSTVACHLANIAYRTGHTVHWDADRETIPGDPAANALVRGTRRAGYELPG